MKNRVLLFILIILSGIGCQSDAPKKTKKNNQHADVPRYKTQDWTKAYKFGSFGAQDKMSKKRLSQKVYNQAWEANHVSAGMLIAQHGQIIYEGYLGMADKARNIALSEETPLHIASTSKVMTALVILKLIEHHKVELDDTLGVYFRGFPYPGVTVRDLLDHRSGLPNYMYFSSDPEIWDQSKTLTNEDVLKCMIEHKPEAAGAPHKHFSYNNTNFVLLALIIERVTHMSYPDAMKYILFDPIGMEHTYVLKFPQDTATASKSYYNNGKPWKLEYLDATYGDKNIYSTPRDMFLLDCAMYAEDFLPDSLKKQATKGYSYESEGIKNYGLGIRMMQWEDGKKFLYHNGWWHGSNTVYVRDYAHEAVIIAFGNKKTRSVYAPFSLVTMFGNYTLPVDSSIIREQDSIRQLQLMQDSIDQAALIEKGHKDSLPEIIPLKEKKQTDTPFRYKN